LRTKRKVSVTIDEDLYEAIDTAARKRRLAKSQVAQEAFRLWLKKQTEALMAKGYEEMADEDKAIAELTFEAQRETVR
jgi:metal-responsive CopG/Arc/MetJ family transcriptional regulator